MAENMTNPDAKALIDPDCAAGKCGSCTGGPCECDCHPKPDPAPGTFWERAVLRRFATGGPVDLETVRQQVGALLDEVQTPEPVDDVDRDAVADLVEGNAEVTDLDQATQHDPAAERLAWIEKHLQQDVRSFGADTVRDLVDFARDVLAFYVDADPTCCDDCAARFAHSRDIRDAAARYLGGGQ